MNVSEHKSPERVAFNLEDLRGHHKTSRDTWERMFDMNYKNVANAIADSIYREYMGGLSEQFNSACLIPTANEPLTAFYQLHLAKNWKEIKERAGDTATLAPFNIWFGIFEARAAKLAPSDDQEILSSLSFRVKKLNTIDAVYFQNQMSRVGHAVKDCLVKRMEDLIREQENGNLRFQVEWYRRDEESAVSFKNPSEQRPNCSIKISAWVHGQQNTTAQAPKEIPKGATCLIS